MSNNEEGGESYRGKERNVYKNFAQYWYHQHQRQSLDLATCVAGDISIHNLHQKLYQKLQAYPL